MALNNLPMAPWEKEMPRKMARKQKKQPMIWAHFSKSELRALDSLQGGPSIDPETGLREYSALSEIIKIPEVKNFFMSLGSELQVDQTPPKDLKNIANELEQQQPPFHDIPEQDKNAEIRRLEQMGNRPDTKIAIIPVDFAKLLIESLGKYDVNEKTGFLEFGIGTELLRIGSTIIGASIGAPFGMPHIGAGLGRTLAGVATGQKFGQAAMSGFKTGLMTNFAANALQGTPFGGFVDKIPGLSHMVGSSAAGTGVFGPGGLFGAPVAGPATVEAGKLTTAAAAGKTAASTAATKAANLAAGAAKGTPSILGNIQNMFGGTAGSFLKSPLGVPIIQGVMKHVADTQDYKADMRKYKEEKDFYDQQVEKQRQQAYANGDTRNFVPMNLEKPKVNPDFFSKNNLSKYGSYDAAPYLSKGGLVQSYSEGTLVKGPGKGQEDLIKTKVPSNSYIIDASSTGMFGDGSSEMGGSILKQFENRIKKSIPKKRYYEIEEKVVSKSPLVPVWLSNDEYKFDPVTVSILGNGCSIKGAKMLKNMVKNLRAHKISNGHRLPPAAKKPEYYIHRK